MHMSVYTADQVADTLLYLARNQHIEITNLKLQKLMYYSQAWNLAFTNKALFGEEFEAWVHGPVIPSLFRRFKHLRWSPITEAVHPVTDDRLGSHLNNVLATYGPATGGQLERLSHSESPWKDARGDLAPEMPSNAVISKDSIRNFYAGLLNGAR
jgi:uncharacterized phage-associated protein